MKKSNPQPNAIGFGLPNPKSMGEKSLPNLNLKPKDIQPKTTHCHPIMGTRPAALVHYHSSHRARPNLPINVSDHTPRGSRAGLMTCGPSTLHACSIKVHTTTPVLCIADRTGDTQSVLLARSRSGAWRSRNGNGNGHGQARPPDGPRGRQLLRRQRLAGATEPPPDAADDDGGAVRRGRRGAPEGRPVVGGVVGVGVVVADPRAAAPDGLRGRPGPARRRAVRQLAAGRGDVQQARLDDGAGQLRGLRRPLHARRALPPGLPRRRRRGYRVRRGAQARRQRQGGVGVRYRRDVPLQPPLLCHPWLRVRTLYTHVV